MVVRNKRLVQLVSLLGVALLASAVRADNPIVQTIYTSDPAPLLYDGRIYLYTGHDEDDLVGGFFTMNEWRVYSSSDMVNWTDHGSPLRYDDFSWSRGDAWAGQVIERNGKFYYYIPTNTMFGGMAIGVGVSDSPIGPFVDALGQPLITAGCNDIDPTVFIDDDGQAYLYWGNPNLCYVELNEDMISYTGDVVRVPMTTQSFGTRMGDPDRPTTYEEGPWFYKRDGLYYLVFAAGPISEHIGYATSPGPTGPWTYGGVIMPTQGASFTNHPGVIDFMGSSYFFYHNGALPGGGGYHRSVCVERFEYDLDGRWPMLDMTSEGVSAVTPLNPYEQVEAETIAWESGVETEPCDEGGMNVMAIDDGDYIRVEEVDFGPGAESFEARVASATSGGSIELHLDDRDGALVGTCDVESTGDWQTWASATCAVSGAMGVHDLYLVFKGTGGPLFNFNWWRFDSSLIPDPDPPDAGVATGGVGGSAGAGAGVGAAGTAGGAAGASIGAAGTVSGTGGIGIPTVSTGGTSAQPVGAAGTLGGASGTGAVAGAAAGSVAGTGNLELGNPDEPAPSDCACRSAPVRSAPAPSTLLLCFAVVLTRLWRRSRGNWSTRDEHARIERDMVVRRPR